MHSPPPIGTPQTYKTGYSTPTTTEQAFDPKHLSRPPLDHGPIKLLIPGLKSGTREEQKKTFIPIRHSN